MTSVRVVSGYLNDQSLSAMAQAQTNLVKTSKQLNTGLFADNYVDLLERSPIESYITTKQLNNSLTQKVSGNQLLSSKMAEMERVVRSFTEQVLPDALKLSFDASNPTNQGVLDVKGLAESILATVKNLLETTFNNQKLFAGSKVNSNQIIGDIVNNQNILWGDATANYYLGDDYIATDPISSTQNLQYGIRASDPGFPELIAGLHELINGNYANANDFINTAKTEIGNIVAELGTHSKVVSNQIKQDQNNQIKLNEFITTIEDADITEVMTTLMNHELQLKASFMLINKLTDLSLVNYLR